MALSISYDCWTSSTLFSLVLLMETKGGDTVDSETVLLKIKVSLKRRETLLGFVCDQPELWLFDFF